MMPSYNLRYGFLRHVKNKKMAAKVLLFLGIIFFAINLCGSQTGTPKESPPNHYILLLDESGSMKETGQKWKEYKRILTDELPARLYKDGFASIPPYNPGKDFLSLFHLGIIPYGKAGEAILDLKKCDLLKDLAYCVFCWRSKVSYEDFKTSINPLEIIWKRLSFIECGKFLALNSVINENLIVKMNSTYLIIVHDAKYMDKDPHKEWPLIRKWGKKDSVDKAEKVIGFIKKNYLFTDGNGKEDDFAFTQQFGLDDNPIFIDTFQIVSRSHLAWKEGLNNLNPISKLDFQWGDQWAQKTEALLKIEFSADFITYIDNYIKEYKPQNRPTIVVDIDIHKSQEKTFTFRPVLDIPIVLSTALPHNSLEYLVELDMQFVLPDKLLGKQLITLPDSKRFIIGKTPVPPRYTWGYWLWWVIIFVILMIALFFIRKRYCRCSCTRIQIKLPGKTFPLAVKMGVDSEACTTVNPEPGACAFSIILPNWFKQLLCFQKLEITCDSKHEFYFYWHHKNFPHIKARFYSKERFFHIFWQSVPEEDPVSVTLTVKKGKNKSKIKLGFPPDQRRKDKMLDEKMQDERIHCISFDLGSESMAAYCKLHDEDEGKNIDLQEFACKFIDPQNDIDYFMTSQNGVPKRSDRLQTLVSLVNRRQPSPLPNDENNNHAKLDIIDNNGNAIEANGIKNYELSLFEFFHKKARTLSPIYIPNPKIPFQEGGGKIIPEVESTDTGNPKVRHKPDELICHMATQIIRNFVLKSRFVRNWPKKDEIGPIKTHLILTIPNVYSLTHAEIIRDFVKKNTEIDEVHTIYESDAVAYYTLDYKIDKFKKFINSLKNGKDAGGYHILAFDIGHGTTDLSLVEINYPQNDKIKKGDSRRKLIIKGRTGKSDGGCRLNYILAEYFNSCLKEIHRLNQFRNLERPEYDFLHVVQGQRTPEQNKVLEALEKMVVKIKMTMTENYRIDWDEKEQEDYINNILEMWIETNSSFKNQLNNDPSLKNSFEKEFKKMFTLRELPGDFKIWFYQKFPKFMDVKIQNLIQLRKDIEDYVKNNTSQLLMQLQEIVASREENQSTWKSSSQLFSKIIKEKPTFVIIAGQASQFRPIHTAIQKELAHLHIPDKHVHFLTGDEAKEACSKGAVVYLGTCHQCANQTEIHGTLGFLNFVPDAIDDFRLVDMNQFNRGEKCSIEFDSLSTYWLFYSPCAQHTITKKNPPEFFNGTTALIKEFRGKNTFEVKYGFPELKIIVNEISQFKVSTYGNVKESIYPKVWPLVLPDIKRLN